MALPTNGPLSLTQINAELGGGFQLTSYRGMDVIDFGGVARRLPSGTIDYSDFLGVAKKPDEEYNTSAIQFNSLQSSYNGYYNASNILINASVTVTLPSYPVYRPKPSSYALNRTWYKYTGGSWVDLAHASDQLELAPTDVNAGRYKVIVTHTAYAPSDLNPYQFTNPGPAVPVVVSIHQQQFTLSVAEFSVANPVITIDPAGASPESILQVVDYEDSSNIDTSGALTHAATISIQYANGAVYGRPFTSLPDATISFQYSADNSTWTTMKTAISSRTGDTVTTDAAMPGPYFTRYRNTNATPAATPGASIGSATTHTWQCNSEFSMKNFAYDTTKTPNPWWDGYYFRIHVSATATYDIAGTPTTKTATAATPGKKLSLVRSFLQTDNQAPESQNITIALPVNGSKAIDITDYVSDPDGETITITDVTYSGAGTFTYVGGGVITLDLAGTNVRQNQTMLVTVTDSSSRPGGPATSTSTITWAPGNQPPINGGYAVTLDWFPPDTSIPTFARNFSLLRNSFDPNGDGIVIDPDSLPRSITGVKQGFAIVESGQKLAMEFNREYSGKTQFNYKVKDSQGALSDFNTATVNIKKTNVAPFISDAEIFITASTTNTVELFNIMSMSDFEGSTVTISAINGVAVNGSTITLNNNTTIDIDASSSTSGQSSTYDITIQDNRQDSRTARLTVSTVAEACPAVSVSNIALGTIFSDQNVELEASIIAAATNGASIETYALELFDVEVTNDKGIINANNVFNGQGALGAVAIRFRVKNSCGSVSAYGSIAGIMVARNTAPVANDFTKKSNYNTAVTINVADYGTDVDNDSLSLHDVKFSGIDITTSGNNVTATPSPKRTVAHSLIFQYRLTDGTDISNWATGRVNVSAKPIPPPEFTVSSANITEGGQATITITLLGANVHSRTFALGITETNASKNFGTPPPDITSNKRATAGDTLTFMIRSSASNYLHADNTVTFTVTSSGFGTNTKSTNITVTNKSSTLFNHFADIVVDEGSNTPTMAMGGTNLTSAEATGWTWATDLTNASASSGSFNLTWNSTLQTYFGTFNFGTNAESTRYTDRSGTITVSYPNGTAYKTYNIISKNTNTVTIPTIVGVSKSIFFSEDSSITGVMEKVNLAMSTNGTYRNATGIVNWTNTAGTHSGWSIELGQNDTTHGGDSNPPVVSARAMSFNMILEHEPQYRTWTWAERKLGRRTTMNGQWSGQFRLAFNGDTSIKTNWASFDLSLSVTGEHGDGPTNPPAPTPVPNPQPVPIPVIDDEVTVINSFCIEGANGNTGYLKTIYSDGTESVAFNNNVCPVTVIVGPDPVVNPAPAPNVGPSIINSNNVNSDSVKDAIAKNNLYTNFNFR